MHVFGEATNSVFLCGVRPYLHSHPTNTNGNDVVCADYGLNSARACYLRCTIIRPILESNGVDFFDGNFRITPLLSLIAKEMMAKAKPDRAIVKAYQ